MFLGRPGHFWTFFTAAVCVVIGLLSLADGGAAFVIFFAVLAVLMFGLGVVQRSRGV